MDTTVKAKAMPKLSVKDGYKSKIGKINICIAIANIKPLPTSIMLCIMSFFIFSYFL